MRHSFKITFLKDEVKEKNVIIKRCIPHVTPKNISKFINTTGNSFLQQDKPNNLIHIKKDIIITAPSSQQKKKQC